MNIKRTLSLLLLALLTVTGTNSLFAADKTPPKSPVKVEAAKKFANKPIKGIGVILINATDPSQVILLTRVPAKNNPQGKMIGIPIMLDDMGKKAIAEFGIKGVDTNEKDGMARIQKESAEKVVYLDGILIFDENNVGKIAVKKYLSAFEFQKQAEAQQADKKSTPASK